MIAEIQQSLIVVFGNCQAQYIASIIARRGLGLVCIIGVPLGFIPSNEGVTPIYISLDDLPNYARLARAMSQPVIFIRQMSPLSRHTESNYDTLADIIIEFPHIELQTYWPINKDATAEWLQRRWTFDLAAIQRSEKSSGWDTKISDFIVEQHRYESLVFTFNHPGMQLLSMLYEELSTRLINKMDWNGFKYQEGLNDIANNKGISFMTSHPIRPNVALALNLEWPFSNWYRLWMNTHYAVEQYDFSCCVELIEVALKMPGCDPHVYYTLGLAYEALGDRKSAHSAYAQAYTAYPTNIAYAKRWLNGLSPDGEMHPAEHVIMKSIQ